VMTATRPLRSKIFWEVIARFRFLIVWPALDGGQMF
jgi:hypothetical protein